MLSSKSHSCLGCNYYNEGSCLWFVEKAGYRKPKNIPIDIRLKGCSKRISDKHYKGEHEEIVSQLIELFEGEFI